MINKTAMVTSEKRDIFFYVCLHLILFFAIGCAPKTKTPPQPPPIPFEIHEESVIGRSVEGRPIKSIVLTFPEERSPESGAEEDKTDVVLMLAAMHGDEVIGTPLLHKLSQYLKDHIQLLKDRKVVLLPEVNPDAIEKQTRRNVNDVDINRDFTSDKPQPETQAVLDAINTHQPSRVITLRELGFIDFDGQDMAEAEEIANHIHDYIDSMPILQIPTSTGSIGHYGETHGVPVITLGIRRHLSLDWEDVWHRFGNGIIAAVTFPRPVPEDIMVQPVELTEDQRMDRFGIEEAGAERENQENLEATEKAFERGAALYESGEYRLAIEAFQSAARHGDCDECEAYIEKSADAADHREDGISNYKDGNLPKAIAALSKAVDLNPKDATAERYIAKSYFGMGLALFKKGAYSEAREKFEDAQLHAHSDLGRSSQKYIAQTIEAENALTKGIDSFEEKKFEEAIDELELVVQINPDDRRTEEYLYKSHYFLAKRELEIGAMTDARYHFEKALKYNRACGECEDRLKALHYNIGRRYFSEAESRRGQGAIEALENAIREWKSAAAIDPDYDNILEKIEKAEEYKSDLKDRARE